MNFKVLLAEDSLTIQKVIKITLANLPYEIIEASSEDALFEKLSTTKPHLVLLDFNLSEKFTGYELTLKIKSISPQSRVLLLLGTFDTVDEQSMLKSGAADKIVKPFDSNKFISICKNLISSFDKEELPYPEILPQMDTRFEIRREEEHWAMGDSQNLKLEKPKIGSAATSVNQKKSPNLLLEEVHDWGMRIPGVIGESGEADQFLDIPPVITKELDTDNLTNKEKIEIRYPSPKELDYPFREDVDEMERMISLSVEEDQPFQLEFESKNSSLDNVKKIEDFIQDEVAQDLWVADEFEDVKKDLELKIENSKPNFQPTRKDFDDSLFRPADDKNSISWNDLSDELNQKKGSQNDNSLNFDLNRLKREIEPLLKDFVKQYLDEMFAKQAEKIAWEVIPDLAENLIKQELTKMSNQALKD